MKREIRRNVVPAAKIENKTSDLMAHTDNDHFARRQAENVNSENSSLGECGHFQSRTTKHYLVPVKVWRWFDVQRHLFSRGVSN